MQLTRLLLFYYSRRHIPGKVDIGKHRLIKPITQRAKRAALIQMIQEQKNLDLLNNPYLTEEEEKGHMITRKQELYTLKNNARRAEKMYPNRLMEDHLGHFNSAKAWE